VGISVGTLLVVVKSPRVMSDTLGCVMPKLPTARQGYSVAQAKHVLGWEPQVFIEEGVRKVLAWVDQQRALKPWRRP